MKLLGAGAAGHCVVSSTMSIPGTWPEPRGRPQSRKTRVRFWPPLPGHVTMTPFPPYTFLADLQLSPTQGDHTGIPVETQVEKGP